MWCTRRLAEYLSSKPLRELESMVVHAPNGIKWAVYKVEEEQQ